MMNFVHQMNLQVRRRRDSLLVVLGLICACWWPGNACSQDVQLNLANEVELRVLVDTVSKQLGVRILYDEVLANNTISIRSPGDIPTDSLLDVLRSALQMKGFLLVDAGVPGWLKIVKYEKLPEVATPGDAKDILKESGSMAAVTQTFVLEHITAEEADQIVKPFLTQPGANSIPIKNRRILIVSDYASNVARIAQWLSLVDKKRPDAVVRFFQLQHIKARDTAEQLTQLLSAQSRTQGEEQTVASTVDVTHNSAQIN